MKTLLFWTILAQGADLTTTVVGLNRGCEERILPFHSPAGVAAWKTGVNVAFVWTYRKEKTRHPRLTRAVALAVLGSGATATALNLHTIPHCGR